MKAFCEPDNYIDVSIVIPVYNGSHLLEKHVTPFLYYLQTKPLVTEILLVDDGSKDRELVRSYAIKHKLTYVGVNVNTGKGNALREGFNKANGKVQLFTDVDIPFQYHNIDIFIELLNKKSNQIVIGDRTHPASSYFEKTSALRNFGSNIVSQIVSRFFISGIRDTQCGLKGMNQSVAKMLFSASITNRFAIDIELIYLAQIFNITIVRCPVQLRCNDKTSVRLVHDGIRLLYDILKIKRIHRYSRRPIDRSGDKIFIPGNYQYEAYYNGSAPQKYWHKFKLDCAIENLDIINAKHLLDVGCGSGVLCSIVAKSNPQLSVTGLDGNPDAILFGKKKWPNLANLSFEEGKVDQLDQYLEAKIDRIAFLEVIEHLTKLQSEQIFKQFFRILGKDGILVISTPNRRSIWPFLEHLLDLLRLVPKLKDEQHEILYSGKELRILAERAGFFVKKKQTVNFIAPWVAFASKKLAERVHKWESDKRWIPGSLLLYTFIKK